MKERSRCLRTRMVRPGALVLLAAAFALGLATWGRWADVAYSQGQGCAVYPIALHEDTLAGAQEGDIFLDIENGAGNGEFGWLAWNDNPVSQTSSALADRIAYPGNSTDPIDGYTNPSDPTDHEIDIGDWIWGHTGAVRSASVRDALNDHVDTGRPLRIPVWDISHCDGSGTECEGDAPGGGAAVIYRVSGFAIVKLIWCDLDKKMIGLQFLRWDNSCGQGGGVDTCDPYVGLYASQTGNYGLEQASNLAVFGPRICTGFGDAYTPLTYSYDGGTPNPWYDELNGVYPFRLDIPSGYESTANDLTQRWNGGADTNDIVRVEIWDPDCYNSPNNSLTITNTVTGLSMTASCTANRKNPCIPILKDPPYNDPQNPFGLVRIDENRGDGSPPGNGTCAEPASYTPGFNTVTEYTLYYYRQQGDGSLERRNLARYTKGGTESDSDTDMRWVSPGGSLPGDPPADAFTPDAGDGNFEIDLSTEAPDIYVNPVDSRRSLFLDVRGVEGASENGFDLWAGPRYINVPGEVNARNVDIILHAGDYHSSAGATIVGIGHLTMNTNTSEAVTTTLAYIPPEWAGRTLYVSSFDNDADAQGLTFIFDTMPYTDWHHDGMLSGNNLWYTNVLTVPSEPEHAFYGGFLRAIYQAGAHDTFGWKMTVPQPDLSGSTKEASGTTVTPGGVLTYTIVVSNIGTQDAPAASLSDPIPDHTTYVTGSAWTDPPGSGVLTETASALEWSGSVAVQEAITLTFQVTVDPDVTAGTQITNTVAISHGACGCYYREATVLVEAPAQTPYIVLNQTCIPEGQAADITVYGYNWPPSASQTIIIQWDGTVKTNFQSRVNWSTVISISASEATSGTHTVRAALLQPPNDEYSVDVGVPCPVTQNELYLPLILKRWPALHAPTVIPSPTATATPLRPDLRITGIDVSPSPPITAYAPVTFTVGIVNVGQGDALNLFWVDLYDLPAGSSPPTASQSQGDATWKAVSSLGAGGTDAVVLHYSFRDPGTRVVYGYVDTRENIDETPYEDNNASQPLTLTITAGTPPTATLAIDPVCSEPGVPMIITVSGEGWPDTGNIQILYDSNPRDSFPSQVNWSRVITLSGSPDTDAGIHAIQAINSPLNIQTNYYIPCSRLGAIDGYTWIFIGGYTVPQSRVDIYCYDGSDLIAQTTSDGNSYYILEHIPPGGPYTVIGRIYIDDVLYTDTMTGITVTAGTTERVDLVLLPQY